MELYDHESDEEQEDLTDVSENVTWTNVCARGKSAAATKLKSFLLAAANFLLLSKEEE